jgi:hypothetical protein
MGHSGIAQQNESTWLILRKKMVINYLVLVHGGFFSDKPTFWYEVIVLEGGFVPKSLSIETQSG